MERSIDLKKALPLSLVAGFFITFLVVNPSRYIASVSRSLILFAKAVLPSLFPFLFFSGLLTCVGGGYLLGIVFAKPVSKVFHAPPISGYVMVLSLISGYPVGSKIICDLYQSGMLTREDAKRITAFCSTSGPLFILGTVGASLFQSPYLGWVLLSCHVLGALVNGIIFRPKKQTFSPILPTVQSVDSLLDACIKNSVTTILAVGGYITVFGMIGDVLVDVGAVKLVGEILGFILRPLGAPSELCYGVALSFIELTRGFDYIAHAGIKTTTALPYLAGLLSLGGACITFQSMSFLSKCGIEARYYILTKISQALVTFGLAMLTCLFVNFG